MIDLAIDTARSWKKPRTVFGWCFALRRMFPEWYRPGDRALAEPEPWPARFNPRKDPVYGFNALFIPNVPPERIFSLLVNARDWPRFYDNAADVVIDGGAPRLEAGARFRWSTFANTQASQVTLYEQDRALGWTAESFQNHAYHRWLLTPMDGGTRVVTEECQNGLTARVIACIMNPGLHATHQLWLTRLSQAATSPLP